VAVQPHDGHPGRGRAAAVGLGQAGSDRVGVARPTPADDDRAVRLRIGIVLWLMSWVPFAAIVGADSAERAAIWTAQVVIGILGLALAGTAFATMVKTVGWRHAPAAAWRTLLHGQTAIVAAAPREPPA
jgi:hypothetical protein